MPLFEYHCRDCEETFEKLQRQPEQQAVCPRCGRPAMRTVSLFAGSAASDDCAAPAGSGFG